MIGRSAVDDLRRWGFVRMLVSVLYPRLRRLGLFVAWVNVRPLLDDLPTADAAPAAAGVQFRPATRLECLRACHDPGLELSAEFVEQAFARDWMCHIAIVHGEVVAYAWRATGTVPVAPGVLLRVPDGYSYGFKAHTRPDHRGKGLYPRLARAEIATCAALGLRRGVSLTEVHNFASMAADARFGNRRVGVIGFLRLGSRVWSLRGRAVRRLGLDVMPAC